MAVFRPQPLGDGGEAGLRTADGEGREDMQQRDLASRGPGAPSSVDRGDIVVAHATRSNGVRWISTARAMKVGRSATGCQSRSRLASLQSNLAVSPRETR